MPVPITARALEKKLMGGGSDYEFQHSTALVVTARLVIVLVVPVVTVVVFVNSFFC